MFVPPTLLDDDYIFIPINRRYIISDVARIYSQGGGGENPRRELWLKCMYLNFYSKHWLLAVITPWHIIIMDSLTWDVKLRKHETSYILRFVL
jgi:hypothetical protein